MQWLPTARRTLRARLLPLMALALLGAACSSEPTDDTPAGALRLFLETMDRSEWDEAALEDAYGLLSEEARAGLGQRARMATSLSGRDFEPWQMLPQGRFRLRFSPRRSGGMVEHVDGDTAVVVVTGSRSGERADVPMVREQGGWRVVIDLAPVRTAPVE